MPAQPTPPNANELQNSFDQFVEAFNKGQFNSESKPGLNDLVAEQAAFTHIHSEQNAERAKTVNIYINT